MPDEKPKLSFSPDKFKKSPETGAMLVDKQNSNPYIMLQSHTQGIIYYTPKTNEYWADAGVLVKPEVFNSKFLPYLSWDYDEIVEDKEGRVINKFPPSTVNIAKKRKELQEAAFENNESVDYEEIMQKTAPRKLYNNAKFEARLMSDDPDEKLLRRLNSSRF